jgi:hypothetical protein
MGLMNAKMGLKHELWALIQIDESKSIIELKHKYWILNWINYLVIIEYE